MAISLAFLAATVAVAVFAATGSDATQKMVIDIGVRSYDGKMWFCNDGVDRPIPAGMRDGGWEKLPKNEQPMMRTRKDGKKEPDYDDCGNAWVAFVSRDHERRAFLTSSDGFHAVWSKFQTCSVEDISGQDYINELPYLTKPTNYEQLEEIAQKLSNKNKGDEKYRGVDYVIDLVFAVADDKAKAELSKSANNWPISLQLLDAHLNEKLGISGFVKRNIPLGTIPSRSQLDREENLLDKRFDPRLANLDLSSRK